MAGPELDVRLLVDHRERLVRTRVALNNTLQWHLHDLWPELELPGGALFSAKWSSRIAGVSPAPSRRCASASPATSCAACASSPHTIKALEARSPTRRQLAPQLLAEPGFGPLTAAKLIGEIAGAQRFATDAKLARAAGIAPIPVSSGKTDRHRLDRGGNRQINAAHPPHRDHPRPLPPRNPRLHRPQTRRRQDHPRRHPLPQAPPHPPHLAPPAAAHPDPSQDTHTINVLT